MDTYVHLSLSVNYGNSHTGSFLGQPKTPKNIKTIVIKLYSSYAFFHSHHLSFNINITYLVLKPWLLVVSRQSNGWLFSSTLHQSELPWSSGSLKKSRFVAPEKASICSAPVRPQPERISHLQYGHVANLHLSLSG